MILSLDPDIYPSPTQKISHEPFPVFSCFFNKIHNLTISFSCSLHPANKSLPKCTNLRLSGRFCIASLSAAFCRANAVSMSKAGPAAARRVSPA